MSGRILKSLAAGVLVLGGLWVYGLFRQVPSHRAPFKELLSRVESIRFQQSGKSLWLKRDGAWRVATQDSGPFLAVDPQRLQSLMDGLQNLQLEDIITERAERLVDFELDDARSLRVTLSDRAATVLSEGLFGKPGPIYGQIYFRHLDQPQVWLARGMSRDDLGGMDFSGWRDHSLSTFPEPDIQAVDIRGHGFQSALILSSTTWLVGGKLADAAKVNTLLGALSHLRAIEFADAVSLPPVAQWASTVVVKSSSTAVTLRVGPLDAKGKRYPVMRTAEEGVAWVEEARMQSILMKPKDLQVK